jgi:hypothetical protein
MEWQVENFGFGVKLKSTKTGKWIWHTGRNGEINRFTKEGAENRAAIWMDESVAKVAKLPATKKKAKKKVAKKKAKKKASKKKTSK